MGRLSMMETAVLVFNAPPVSLSPLQRRAYVVVATIVLGDLPLLGAASCCDGLRRGGGIAWRSFRIGQGRL
jgi:hypothetical protein